MQATLFQILFAPLAPDFMRATIYAFKVCPEITRTTQIEHIFTTKSKELREVAERCLEFDQKIDDQSNVSEN